MHSDKLALKICGHGYFCSWSYWICIFMSFRFRHISNVRVLKLITLHDLLATLHFLAFWFFSMYCGFFISLFATVLICAALVILRWSICKWDVASVFFNLRVVSKSPAEIYTPIGAVLELRSRNNLPRLVKLALKWMHIDFNSTNWLHWLDKQPNCHTWPNKVSN